MNAKKPIIEIKNVSYSYESIDGRRISALDDISLSVERGSFVAVLGHNGSGKSTLAKLLNMILTPEKGEIFFDGERVSGPGDIDEDIMYAVRRRVGMVHQNPDNQIVATIVEEDVAFGPENLGIPPEEIRRRVDTALAAVGMTEYARHAPHRLSGGQKQRVAIAGILAMLPECIIFDESTAMLDPSGRAEVMEIIKKLNKERNITIILITHDMMEAAMADRIVILNDGRVYADGTPQEIFSQVDRMRAIKLDVPETTAFMYELSSLGLTLPRGVFNVRECAEAVVRALIAAGKVRV